MKHFIRSIVCLFAVASFSLPALASNAESPTTPSKVQVGTVVNSSTLNLNTASAAQIVDAHLKGIGKKRAEQIVAYRDQHGPFKTIDDLKNIKGLGGKFIDENRSRLSVE